VERSVTDSVWTHAFGLRPLENPLLVFGPGWDSNLASSLVRVRSLLPDGSQSESTTEVPRVLNSNITVRDYQGRAYGFLEYTGGDSTTRFIADPTMLPERGTAGITLATGANGTFILTQPLLGFTHTYSPTPVDFKIPNNRDTASDGTSNATGFTGFQYYRLVSVTDRFGVTLNYTYGNGNTSNLVPDVISVAGRSQLQLRIQQSGGKIQAFWDPSGVKHTYTYASRNLTAANQSASFNVLTSHMVGPLTAASYGYQYAIEADPRPASMFLQTASTPSTGYTIQTYHIEPNSFENGKGEKLVINYKPSEVRQAYSVSAGAYYYPAGDPLLVDHVILPNETPVPFVLTHTLKNGRPAIPADGETPAVDAIPSVFSIVTGVTDMWGNHWTYLFDTPTTYRWLKADADAPFLPTASVLFFPKLTRSCAEVLNSSIEFRYDASAGFALSLTKDAARFMEKHSRKPGVRILVRFLPRTHASIPTTPSPAPPRTSLATPTPITIYPVPTP